MFGSHKCVYTQDLKLLLVASLLSVIFILVSPFNEISLMRIAFALILIFFIPGYAFISVLFPGNKEISGIERFTLSVGFSIVIMVFDGFIVSLTEWKFRPDSITVSLVILTLLFMVLTFISRRRLPEEDQFSFSYRSFIQSLSSSEQDDQDIEDEETGKEEADRKFSASNRKRISPVSKKKSTFPGPSKKNDISPQITKALIIAMVLSIIIAGAMFAYAKATREKETFTALYILGPDGKAENYPENFSTSEPIKVIAGMENYEHSDVNYTLQVKLDQDILEEIRITLGHEEKWEKDLTLTPTRIKQGRQKLEFALYKEEVGNFPYRSVHLWVNQQISTESIEAITPSTVDFIEIENPSMETDDGWEFISTNDTSVTGMFLNDSGIRSSRAFVMNSTYEGILTDYTSHTLQQNVSSSREANVILACYLRDTYTEGTPDKDETQYKRVFFNQEPIWIDGFNGDEGWQHLQIPVTLKEGINILSFTMIQSRDQTVHHAEMIIDEVSFLPASEISPYVREDNTIETDLPVSKVLPLPPSVNNETFTVTWNGTDEGSGIYYYDIDYSTDGVNWNRWLSRTPVTSAEFDGKQGNTYYFRSKAVDNALNEEIEHAVADTSTEIDLSAPRIELDITPNPTSDTTYLTLEASKPLMEVECLITPQTFGSPEYIELKTEDNMVWTAKYTVEVQDNYNVEIFAKDYANNTAYALDTIYTDETLEELTIDIDPEKTSDDVEITITSSIALEGEPTVTVRDRYGYKLDIDLVSSSDSEYVYSVTTDDEDLDYSIRDGTARVIVTAKTINSLSLYEEETFIIDRKEPSIKSIFPENGETVTTGDVSIRASYYDDRVGIDKTKIRLQVNGVDVTDNAEIDYSSMSYTASGLANGEVEVILSITDQAGNTEIETWRFYVSTL